tara:strand:+ start:2089 stop:2679 length:591 start_codon:yes stop_codon:yes gene_type:complete
LKINELTNKKIKKIMACLLTTGRKVPCKSGFGGIKRVYFANYGSIASVTLNSDNEATIVVSSDGPPEWFEYDVKGASSLETTVTSSRDNGTTFYTQTLNLTLTFLDSRTQAELQILAVGRPYAVVEDYYGNSFLLGLENGLELTGGTIVTGAAAGDLTGFTLTFEGMEERAPYFLEVPVSGAAAQIDPTPAGVPAY